MTESRAAKVTVSINENSWTAILATDAGLPPLDGVAVEGVVTCGIGVPEEN